MYTVTVLDNLGSAQLIPGQPMVGGTLQADSELMTQIAHYKLLKEAIKRDEERLSLLRGKIAEALGGADIACDEEGLVLCTYKESAASMRFDAKAFEAAKPALYKQYLKESKPVRVLLVK